jgi:hypothetical protein
MNKRQWRNILLGLGVAVCMALLQSCTTPLRVDRVSGFKPQSKTVGMLTVSRFDNKLRVALAKRGFTVLKFASNKTIIGEGNGNEMAEIYKKAESTYGLSLSYQIIDTCLINDSVKINASLELADLAKNEVIFVIQRGGWTGPCGWHGSEHSIFDELADAMAHEWENPK